MKPEPSIPLTHANMAVSWNGTCITQAIESQRLSNPRTQCSPSWHTGMQDRQAVGVQLHRFPSRTPPYSGSVGYILLNVEDQRDLPCTTTPVQHKRAEACTYDTTRWPYHLTYVPPATEISDPSLGGNCTGSQLQLGGAMIGSAP